MLLSSSCGLLWGPIFWVLLWLWEMLLHKFLLLFDKSFESALEIEARHPCEQQAQLKDMLQSFWHPAGIIMLETLLCYCSGLGWLPVVPSLSI